MAFPAGWSRKQPIVIQNGQVGSGGVTNFDVLITRDHLDDEVVSPTDSNAGQSDGGDVRFSSDAQGSTQLACDIINWEHDTTDGAGDADIQARVLVPSISDSVDTTIYIWYKTAGTTTQPAANESYGSDNAYDSSVRAYYAMEEDPSGSAPQMLDRTSNGFHGTSIGTMTSGDVVPGQFGNNLDFDGTDDAISIPSGILSSPTALTVAGWFQMDNTSSEYRVFGFNHNGVYISIRLNRGGTANRISGIVAETGPAAVEVFTDGSTVTNRNFIVLTAAESGNVILYVNGASVGSSAITSFAEVTDNGAHIGTSRDATGAFTNGQIDDISIHNIARSVAWVATRYNNENAPATFATAGTPAQNPIPGGAGINRGLVDFGLVRQEVA